MLDLVGLGDLSTKRVAQALRRPAAAGGARPGAARRPADPGARRAHHRPGPDASAPTCAAASRSSPAHCAVLLSTHQTEDVAALCERVVVLAGGTVRFDGTVTDLVATAAGRVWLCDEPGADALVSWRTGTGRHHVVGGTPPPGAMRPSRPSRTPTCSCSARKRTVRTPA